jgi:drug/metabolite transporter (DMT)-like permease
MGVKNIGGMQTAIIGLSELLVAMVMAQIWLGERLSVYQWIGALLLIVSILLIGKEKPKPVKQTPGGWLSWLSHPTLPSDIPWQPRD